MFTYQITQEEALMDQAQRLTYPHITGDVKFHFLIHFQLFPNIQYSTDVQKASHDLTDDQQ